MRNNSFKQKKSPKQRFLLVIGIFFFLVYLFLGLTVIFWKSLPLAMEYKYRVAFGVLLITYALIRFYRYYKSESSEE